MDTKELLVLLAAEAFSSIQWEQEASTLRVKTAQIQTTDCWVVLNTNVATLRQEVAIQYGSNPEDPEDIEFELKASVPDFLKWVSMLDEIAEDLRQRTGEL